MKAAADISDAPVKTGERIADRPVYTLGGRFRIAWFDRAGFTEFAHRSGWVVYDLDDPYENPDSPRFDPIRMPHRRLKDALSEARHRNGNR